ncbi:CHAT domain-containing protein [Suillus cothurnatus]|nr:CHAT domain-containing protein [Suillus cothurnatus]
MARHRRVTFESSTSSASESDSESEFFSASSDSDSESDFFSVSSHHISPLENSAESLDNDNDSKTKSPKRPQSQEKENEQSSYPEHTQDPGKIHFSAVQQVVITAIHATDLTLGLLRVPVGFHVVVKTDGAESQTSNKPVHVDQAVVEWSESILLPCDTSSKVRVSVYASYELSPMLCHGEILRTFEISVRELLDRSENSRPIIFQPKQGEVVSPCTSLFMTLEQRLSVANDAAVICPITILTSRDMGALAVKTDAGYRLLARYRRTQNSSDLDQSIKHFERALDLCPMDHPYRPAALFNLATAKLVSCQAGGRYLDLDIPINWFQDALGLRPIDHPDRTVTQLHLAIALLSRFTKRGFQTDADTAEELLSEVLDACHADSHIHRAALIAIESSALHSAGRIDANDPEQEWPAASMLPLSPNQLAERAEWCSQRDDLHALDEVISLHYDALGYYNTGHADRGQLLGNLSVLLLTRFQRRGNDRDLEQAIALQRQVLALHPVGHTDRSKSLNNLANQLSSRFQHRGNDEDLDQAIALHREALALRPVGHTGRSTSLNNLAYLLSSRFEHRGNDEDLDQAIALQREALALHPVGHTDRSKSLNNLANLLSSRFQHRGNEEDLDQAIALHREALAFRPVGHTDRSMSLNNLACQLSSRFEHRGNDEDLDQAIAFQREAVALRPVAPGNDEDLDQAIAFQREAVALRPVGHTDRSSSLNNLANRLSSRFERRCNDEDLDRLSHFTGSAGFHPHRGNDEDLDQAHRTFTGKRWLCARSAPRHDEDLDEAIALQREALALRPVGHTDRSASLNNLANRLSSRFERRGNDEDLDQAIALHREALALRPVGHTDRSKSLNNLALQLCTRFEHRRNREDFDESRDNLRCALTLLTQYDPFQLTVHRSLAIVYLSFHDSVLDGTNAGEGDDSMNAVMHHLQAAANVVSAGLLPRLRASLRWVHLARHHSHGTELEAYTTSMQLLDAYMSTTASVSSRHNIMKEFPSTLAVDAASCALRRGDVRRAVELLEQGRTIIWTQMTRPRTPLESLQTRGDHAAALVKRFRDLSSLLDKPPANEREATPRVDVEAEEARYRRLVKDWNGAVEEIRKIEGFSRFLLSPSFSDLRDAARGGPIIVLIASMSSCDAVIIWHEQPPTHISLPTTLEKLLTLVDRFQRRSTLALTAALIELWDEVVCPVVRNLGPFAPRGSRIWWCPTSLFNFLPLHAAGEYRGKWRIPLAAIYLFVYAISYRADEGAQDVMTGAPGASFTLECVEPELELVRSLLPPAVSFTKISSVDATRSRALSALQDNTWLHFSCHGTQNFDEPFNSAFLMRDQPLSLLDITQMDLSRHEFTFLSACETAVGTFSTPDEVIHLAAGLQFAGVKSVIGTLWTVDDSTVQRLVEAFYKNLCKSGKMNSKRAAWALHQAVGSLARDKDIPLDQRIVFIHIGV